MVIKGHYNGPLRVNTDHYGTLLRAITGQYLHDPDHVGLNGVLSVLANRLAKHGSGR